MFNLSVIRIDGEGNTASISQILTLSELCRASRKFSDTHNKMGLNTHSIHALFQLYINMSSQQNLKCGIITKK
jgi:hypothetical protein